VKAGSAALYHTGVAEVDSTVSQGHAFTQTTTMAANGHRESQVRIVAETAKA